MKDYRSLAAELVSELKKQGADAADVYIVSSVGFNTTVRLGKIERLQQSISKGLGLRVIKNGAMANTFTTDFMRSCGEGPRPRDDADRAGFERGQGQRPCAEGNARQL